MRVKGEKKKTQKNNHQLYWSKLEKQSSKETKLERKTSGWGLIGDKFALKI